MRTSVSQSAGMELSLNFVRYALSVRALSSVDLDPIFPAGVFQGGHHFHGLFLFGNVFVRHVIPACDLEFVEYFGIEITDGDVLEEVGILRTKRVNSDEMSDADEL